MEDAVRTGGTEMRHPERPWQCIWKTPEGHAGEQSCGIYPQKGKAEKQEKGVIYLKICTFAVSTTTEKPKRRKDTKQLTAAESLKRFEDLAKKVNG